MLQAIPRYVGSLGTASDGFFSLAPTGIFQTSTPSLVEVIWPTSGVFRNLYTVLSDDPGTGDVRVFKLRIAGTDSALTTTHAATDVTSKNTADVVAITAGQRVVMILDTTGTADAANLHYTIEFDSDTAYASAYAANISTTTSGFVDIFTGRTNASADICRRYIPCDGTISKLVGTNMSSSVGPSVSLTFYIYKNGVKQDGTGGTVDTALVITNIAQYGVVTKTFTLPVVRGDYIYTGIEISGSYPSSHTSIGMQFDATTAGQSILASISANNPSDSVANYAHAQGDGSTTSLWGSGNNFQSQLRCGVSDITLSDWLALTDTDPGVGNTRTLELLNNGTVPVDTPQGVWSNGVLQISDVTNSATFTEGQTIGPVRHTPASTPTTTGIEWWSFTMGAVLPTPGGGGGIVPGVNPTPGVIPTDIPEVFAILTLDGVDYPYAVGQLNDDPSWFSGEKNSRILDITSIKYQLTKEGGPEAVTFTLSLLDGDRVFHDMAGSGSQIRNGFCSVYVVDRSVRLAEGIPKRIGAGYITKYEGGDRFVFKVTVKDPLFMRLAKIDKEPTLPRGRFTLTDFPSLDPSRNGHAIPLIMGKVSDEASTPIQGDVPPIYVGTINLFDAFGGVDEDVDAYIWAQGAFVANGITTVWYNDPTTPLVRFQVPSGVWGVSAWTPFFPGWSSAVPSGNNYVDYNGRRYTPFFIQTGIPQAELVRTGNILIAANIYGTEDQGDSTGAMIDDPATLTAFILNQYVFNDYLTGTYDTIPTFDQVAVTPYSWIDTTTFDDVKTYFDGRLTGGYTAGFILGADGQAVTVFQFLQDMCAGIWMDLGLNLDGQLIASVYDPASTPVATFDATSDIEGNSYTVSLDETRLINRVEHEFAKYYVAPYAPAPTPAEGDPVPSIPIPDYPEYRSGVQITEDTASQTLVGDVLILKHQNKVIRETAVALDISDRIIEASLGPTGAGPHVFSLKGGWNLLAGQLGKNIYVIHPAKFGSGTRDLCRVTTVDIYPMQHRVVLGGDVIAHDV